VKAALAPLAEREFRFLFLGRTVSLLGSAGAPIALAFAVLDTLDASATALGIVLAAEWVPRILFILLGGVWADRLPRNLVMVGSNLLSGAGQAVAALLLLTGNAEIWHLVALQVVRGTASSFFFPASQGIVPQTVSAERLQEANALLRLSMNAVLIGGAALGGLAVAAVGPPWAIAFDAATYVISAWLLGLMRLPARVRDASSRFVDELREGWDEFRSRTWLWAIVVGAMAGNAARMGGFFVLGPVIAEEELGGAAAWGTILAFESAGLVVGGLLALRLRPARPLLAGQVALLAMAPSLALLAAPAPLALLLLAALGAGVGLELFSVYWDTTLQQHVPLDVLSRVASYDALGSFVAIPAGMSLAGPLADAIGTGTTLWIAFGVAVGSVLFGLAFADVRTLPRGAPLAGAA
jgi:predicted MFS family arabinose efflux permease